MILLPQSSTGVRGLHQHTQPACIVFLRMHYKSPMLMGTCVVKRHKDPFTPSFCTQCCHSSVLSIFETVFDGYLQRPSARLCSGPGCGSISVRLKLSFIAASYHLVSSHGTAEINREDLSSLAFSLCFVISFI